MRNVLEDLIKDVRYALRMYRRNSAFAATAIVALALGMGASTAVFSVVKTVLLDPLAFRDADRLVQLLIVNATGPAANASVPKYVVWRDQTDVFEQVAAYNPRSPSLNVTGGSEPVQVRAVPATAELFQLFGAPVMLGRTFSPDEDRPNGPLVAVLSFGLWSRLYGADPAILGKTIQLGGRSRTIIGVVGPRFVIDPHPQADLWIPFQFDLNTSDQTHSFVAVARLRRGITVDMARAQMRVAEAKFRQKFPTAMAPRDGFSVESLRDNIVGNVRPSLLVLMGAVTLVMLIGCANVANLLLFRAVSRQQEVTVRIAIGASRWRLVRQLLTETVVLFAAGGLVGLGVAAVMLRLVFVINPSDIPRIGEFGDNVALDWHVLVFTAGMSLVCALVFGLLPALWSSRADLSASLQEAGGRGSSNAGQKVMAAALVISEVALSVVLLVGTALLIRTFGRLISVDPGFKSRNVLTLQMSLGGEGFDTTARVAQLVRDGVNRIEALPGVTAAAISNALPPENRFVMSLTIPTRSAATDALRPLVGWAVVSSQYFDVMHIPLRRGRLFNRDDDRESPPVVIINDVLARQFFSDVDPLNQTLLFGVGMSPQLQDVPRLIVGTVGAVRDVAISQEPRGIAYVPVAQLPNGVAAWNTRIRPFYWFVSTTVIPQTLRPAIERELQQASGRLPVGLIRTMDEVLERATASERFNMELIGLLGLTAVLLAAIGIYGLLAYSVQQRRHEFAIRICMGAQIWDIRQLVIKHGLALGAVGLAIGLAAALALARLMTSILFGVKPWDVTAFVATTGVLGLAVAVAVCVPAIRAGRLHPMNVLRGE